MASYVILAGFSDQGIKGIKDTVKRSHGLRDQAKSMGVTVKHVFWTLGIYDVVLVLEAESDEVIASFMMKIGSLGNLKSQTLRAFTDSEVEKLISKI